MHYHDTLVTLSLPADGNTQTGVSIKIEPVSAELKKSLIESEKFFHEMEAESKGVALKMAERQFVKGRAVL